MMLPTGITYGVCLIVFLILGFTGAGGTADMAQAHALGDAIHGLFTINPLLLLPPVIVIVSIALKVPALPGIALGIISGIVFGMIFQGENASLWKMMVVGYDGFTLDGTRGIDAVDNLLQRGGINSMLSSISLTTPERMEETILRLLEIWPQQRKTNGKAKANSRKGVCAAPTIGRETISSPTSSFPTRTNSPSEFGDSGTDAG